tara:strand:- start:8602 stop:8853 length:252 start_codon:yes stop_codon:yes gene_type:complete
MVPKRVQKKVGLVTAFMTLLLCLLTDRRCPMENEAMKRISPEKAMKILKAGGLEIDIEQTKEVLAFLYKLADIAIYQNFRMPR